MNRSARVACVAVSLVCFLLALLTTGGRGHDPSQPAPAVEIIAAPQLTVAEAARLRRLVERGLGTGMAYSGRWISHRTVVVEMEVSDLHGKKRIATLQLLLEITRTGKPEDVLTARGFAEVLEGGEEGVIDALGYADYPVDAVDAAGEVGEKTGRQWMIEDIERKIVAAQKQVRLGR